MKKGYKSLTETARSLYNSVLGQCSRLMMNKASLTKDYVRIELAGNVTKLLKEIRRVSLYIENNTSVYATMDDSKSFYYRDKQERIESKAKYSKKFESIVEAIEHLGGKYLLTSNYKRKLDVKKGGTPVRDDVELVVCVKGGKGSYFPQDG